MRVLVAAFCLVSTAMCDVILTPPVTTNKPVGLVFIQGGCVKAELYIPLLSEIGNRTTALSMWVGVPSFTLSTPDPLTISGKISGMISTLQTQGLPEDADIVIAGHSLGTVVLQSYLTSTKLNISATVLMGGYIARSHLMPSFSFPFPTLTLAGELDGLARVTRTGAEAFYHQIHKNSDPVASEVFPVVVVPGMCHWQFASGEPTSFVAFRDLIPEIENDAAHDTVSALVVDYLEARLASGAGETVKDALADTLKFLEPLFAAYELEGSRHFNAPAQIGGVLENTCVKGGCSNSSEWARRVQGMISEPLPEGSDFKLTYTNEYVKMSATPITGDEFHLPNFTKSADNTSAVITTFSQGSWDILDRSDAAFSYTSAKEIGAKLLSRQCSLIGVTGNESIPFTEDDTDFCRQANEAAYKWALNTASETTRNRFLRFGEKYKFGADIQKAGGPLFINAGISYKESTVNGTKIVTVSSPAQKTEKDYWKNHFPFPRPSWIPDPGCYHYCKLLSPARAMEWIYVDGLRAGRSNTTACDTCLGNDQVYCPTNGQCYVSGDSQNPCGKDSCMGTGCNCTTCRGIDCMEKSQDGPRYVKEALLPMMG